MFKKWIESWLVPFVNKIADTPEKKKFVYYLLAAAGILMAVFGATLSYISIDRASIISGPIDQGALK